MSEVNNGYVLKELREQFGSFILSSDEPFGMLTVEVDKSQIFRVIDYLKNHPVIKVQFLTDLCGIHNPDKTGNELGVVYHLHSLTNNFRVRLKSSTGIADPRIDSITSIFPAANWQERETYDFYGILFEGHPNLKRILNVDEMDYFPLRREYPLEDQTRTDKNDSYFGR